MNAGLWVIVYLAVFLLSQSLALSILVNNMMQRRAVSAAQAAEMVLASQAPVVLAIAALIGLPILFFLVYLRRISWNELLLQKAMPLKRLLACFILGLALNQALYLLISFARVFPFFEGIYATFTEGTANLNSDGSVRNTFSLLLMMGFVVPVYEEVVYRALIFRELASVSRARVAMVAQAIIFAVCHGNLLQGLFSFALALLLSRAYLSNMSIWAPCAIHCGFNTSAYLFQLVLLKLAAA